MIANLSPLGLLKHCLVSRHRDCRIVSAVGVAAGLAAPSPGGTNTGLFRRRIGRVRHDTIGEFGLTKDVRV
jgi:hypothetical protein